jgi:hypothetical protein
VCHEQTNEASIDPTLLKRDCSSLKYCVCERGLTIVRNGVSILSLCTWLVERAWLFAEVFFGLEVETAQKAVKAS